MATGFIAATANAILNALTGRAAWTNPSALYVKLHTGDPGAAGTSNAATNTTRQQATFGTDASGGAISNTVAITWTNVAGSEDYTHFSAWDNVSAGSCHFTGTITANAVTAGDTFTVAIGDLDITLGIAS